jgi:Domain of unknown function (DUF397)
VIDLSNAAWLTSSKSGNNGGCVEVAHIAGHVAVRDSKDRTLPALIYTATQWNRLLHDVRAGVDMQIRDGMVCLTALPNTHVLAYTPFEWECFIDGVAKGEFDQPDTVAA